MTAGTALYTPEVLALATSLAKYPWDNSLPLQGEVRSRSCGSSLKLCLSLDADGRIDRIGLTSHACAIGQSAAAIFAKAATGRTQQDISQAGEAISAWLSGTGNLPDWPGLDAIAAARDYPGRHAAILLAWNAARDILPLNGKHG